MDTGTAYHSLSCFGYHSTSSEEIKMEEKHQAKPSKATRGPPQILLLYNRLSQSDAALRFKGLLKVGGK